MQFAITPQVENAFMRLSHALSFNVHHAMSSRVNFFACPLVSSPASSLRPYTVHVCRCAISLPKKYAFNFKLLNDLARMKSKKKKQI